MIGNSFRCGGQRRWGGFESLLGGVVKDSKEVETGQQFKLIDGGEQFREAGGKDGGVVGDESGEHAEVGTGEGQDRLEDMRGDVDLAGAQGQRGRVGGEGSGDDDDGIGVAGEAADQVLEAAPYAVVDGGWLGNDVGQQEGVLVGGHVGGEVGGGDEMAAVEAGVGEVAVGSGGTGEGKVGAEAGTGRSGMAGGRKGELVDGPEGEFPGGVVAKEEAGVNSEFEVGTVAGGETEAAGLGGEEGGGEEKDDREVHKLLSA